MKATRSADVVHVAVKWRLNPRKRFLSSSVISQNLLSLFSGSFGGRSVGILQIGEEGGGRPDRPDTSAETVSNAWRFAWRSQYSLTLRCLTFRSAEGCGLLASACMLHGGVHRELMEALVPRGRRGRAGRPELAYRHTLGTFLLVL